MARFTIAETARFRRVGLHAFAVRFVTAFFTTPSVYIFMTAHSKRAIDLVES